MVEPIRDPQRFGFNNQGFRPIDELKTIQGVFMYYCYMHKVDLDTCMNKLIKLNIFLDGFSLGIDLGYISDVDCQRILDEKLEHLDVHEVYNKSIPNSMKYYGGIRVKKDDDTYTLSYSTKYGSKMEKSLDMPYGLTTTNLKG